MLYRHRNRPPLNFYITDFWAAVLGLLPAYYIVATTFQRMSSHPIANVMGIAGLLCCQVLGMVAGRIMSTPRPDEKMPRQFNQFLWIWVGALTGSLIALTISYITCLNCLGVIIGLPVVFETLLGKGKKP